MNTLVDIFLCSVFPENGIWEDICAQDVSGSVLRGVRGAGRGRQNGQPRKQVGWLGRVAGQSSGLLARMGTQGRRPHREKAGGSWWVS